MSSLAALRGSWKEAISRNTCGETFKRCSFFRDIYCSRVYERMAAAGGILPSLCLLALLFFFFFLPPFSRMHRCRIHVDVSLKQQVELKSRLRFWRILLDGIFDADFIIGLSKYCTFVLKGVYTSSLRLSGPDLQRAPESDECSWSLAHSRS